MACATGWSIDYILNRVNYQTLIMMLRDAPGYRRVKGKSDDDTSPSPEEMQKSMIDEAREVEGFFQSELK